MRRKRSCPDPTAQADLFDDRLIEIMASRTQCAIKTWAKRNGLWYDTWLKVPHEHSRDCPRGGELFLVCSEGGLYKVWNGGDLQDEFMQLLEQHGCWFELDDHCTALIYPNNDTVAQQSKRYNRFNWIKSLAAKRTLDIHVAIYKHFAEYPEDLKKLDWREYEVVLDAIFTNCGFRTELGPGSGDGGIDLRLYQGDLIGELVTLVQAKRYRARPVGLESVAALSGIVEANKAHRGLVVTTSRFLPVAQRFARLDTKRIELAGLNDVRQWCGQISDSLSNFLHSGKLDQSRLLRSYEALNGPLVGTVVHANIGYNRTKHEFCRVIAESRYEVILERLPTKLVSGDWQEGTEVPILDNIDAEKARRFIAFRHDTHFWGERHLYTHWGGEAIAFNSD